MPQDPSSPFAVVSGPETLVLTKLVRGGLVFSSDLAQRIAEILFEAHRGKDELERQRPLLVTDKDTYWRIEGSRNRDGKINGLGAVFVSIEKYDGRVSDFGQWFPCPPDPSVVPLLQQHLKNKRSETDQ